MAGTTKKSAKRKTTRAVATEYRPYRVLFLVVIVAVTCLVLFISLGIANDR